MNALILTHIETEGPGLVLPVLEWAGAQIDWARLEAGDSVPDDPRDYDVIVSMGGPMNVDDDDRHSWLAPEKEFLRRAIESDKAVLGICLGAQLIARAAGAEVRKGIAEEIGWSKVMLTEEGKQEPALPTRHDWLMAFQWHGDMFEIPDGAKNLGRTDACANQAFRCRNALALQFHLEATDDMIRDWFPKDPRCEEWLKTVEENQRFIVDQAQIVFRGFLKECAGTGA